MKKGKFNFVDVIIILIIAAAVIGGLWYLNKDDDGQVTVSGKEHRVFIAEAIVDKDTVNNIQVGDKLVALDSFQDAEITDIQVFDYEAVTIVNGEIITYPNADKVRLVVTIEGNVNKYGPFIELGGQEIKAGSRYWIKTDTLQAYGYVMQIIE